jgi:hypothetical protein
MNGERINTLLLKPSLEFGQTLGPAPARKSASR